MVVLPVAVVTVSVLPAVAVVVVVLELTKDIEGATLPFAARSATALPTKLNSDAANAIKAYAFMVPPRLPRCRLPTGRPVGSNPAMLRSGLCDRERAHVRGSC